MRAVIFDLFGVVCEEIGRPWLHRSVPETDQKRVHEEYFVRGDLGTIEEQDFFDGLAAASGQDAHAIRDEWHAAIRETPGMFALVERIRGKHPVALCTNASRWFFESVEEKVRLRERFDVVVVSAEQGVVKAGKDIYERTCALLNVAPEEAVFVDDRPENVEGAVAAGLSGILFTGTEVLEKELAELGVA